MLAPAARGFHGRRRLGSLQAARPLRIPRHHPHRPHQHRPDGLFWKSLLPTRHPLAATRTHDPRARRRAPRHPRPHQHVLQDGGAWTDSHMYRPGCPHADLRCLSTTGAACFSPRTPASRASSSPSRGPRTSSGKFETGGDARASGSRRARARRRVANHLDADATGADTARAMKRVAERPRRERGRRRVDTYSRAVAVSPARRVRSDAKTLGGEVSEEKIAAIHLCFESSSSASPLQVCSALFRSFSCTTAMRQWHARVASIPIAAPRVGSRGRRG